MPRRLRRMLRFVSGNRHGNERNDLALTPSPLLAASDTKGLDRLSPARHGDGDGAGRFQSRDPALLLRPRPAPALSTDVMTSMRFMTLWIAPGIVTVSYGKPRFKRRSSPEAYAGSVSAAAHRPTRRWRIKRDYGPKNSTVTFMMNEVGAALTPHDDLHVGMRISKSSSRGGPLPPSGVKATILNPP